MITEMGRVSEETKGGSKRIESSGVQPGSLP